MDERKVTLVGESYVERDWPGQRCKPIFPHGDGMDRLARILDALSEPAMGRRQEGDDCSAELLCYLVLEAAARNGDESLLRPKVHFFLRGLDEMVVALNGTPDQVFPKLYLSLHDAKEGEGGGRHDDSFLPVLTCRNCGQHFFERHYQDLDFTYGSGNRIRGFENGDAVVDAKGHDNEGRCRCNDAPGQGARVSRDDPGRDQREHRAAQS